MPTLPRICTSVLLATLVGCGGSGGSGEPQGSLSISITDAPVHDVSEVWVRFTGVRVKPAGGPAIEFPFATAFDVDLLTLTGATSRILLNDEAVPAGRYEWIALDVSADFDSNFDSYVVDAMGGMVELRVPSQEGVRLVSGFTVLAGGATDFIIDWDLLKALTNPAGQPGYVLRPALRITDLAEYGSLGGSVADGLLMGSDCANDLASDRGNSVYVYEGADQTPVDIDGDDPEPLATAEVALDAMAAGAYTYRVDYLPPGAYTVAFTCQGLAEDPEEQDPLEFIGTQNVTVIADQEAVADFD